MYSGIFFHNNLNYLIASSNRNFSLAKGIFFPIIKLILNF